MLRPKLAPLTAFLLFSAACGGPSAGGGGGGAAKGPSGGSGAATHDEKQESIGELAASQGGLAALGGAGNRDESGATGTEVAMGSSLRAEEVEKGHAVKVDGVLKEWGARAAMRDAISGKTEGLGLEVAVQYDDGKLYVGGEVTDPKPARSGKHDASEDHVRFTVAFPSGRGALHAYEIGLWAGKAGESAGAVKWLSGPQRGQEVAGAKIVENETKGGYTFETAIPWASFGEARTMRVGLRAGFRYHDGDGGEIGSVHGSVDKPGELPPLPTEAEQAVVDGLLAQKNLQGEAPKIDVYADVAGDERKERISVFGRFFTICGPGYRGGHQFFWREVVGDVAALEARDVTGRGKEDLVVRRRIGTKGAVHETVEVWSLAGGEEPVSVFAQEASVHSSDGKQRVTNAVRVSPKEIEVAVEPAVGWDARTYKEGSPEGVDPVLLPWGTVKSRTFKYEGGRFAKASEIAQAGVDTSAPATNAQATAGPAQALPRDVPTPAVKPAAADLGKQVLEAYYRDAGVPAGTKPRFDLEVNVDGDGRPERVLLVGRDIVVLGPGFKGGAGYARMSLSQFGDDKDIGELTARDVTGDGQAELLVRGVRHVSSTTGEKVDVEGLFIYQLKGGNVQRVLAIETGRELAGKRVQGLVQFVPAKGGKGLDVDVRPGVAKGWTEKTYPWPQDKPGGAIEPLLLPWGKVPSLRYTWNGSQFTTTP